jgi:hypothetical protein
MTFWTYMCSSTWQWRFGRGHVEEGGGNVDLVGSDEHDVAFVYAL